MGKTSQTFEPVKNPAVTTAQRRWLTIPEAAAEWNVAERTVRRWLAAGIIAGKRIGPRLIRVDAESFDNAGRNLAVIG